MKKGRVKRRNYKVSGSGLDRIFHLRYGEKFSKEHDGLWPTELPRGVLPLRLSPFKWAVAFEDYFRVTETDPETLEVKMTDYQAKLMAKLSQSISECFTAKTGAYLRDLASAVEALSQDAHDNNLARLYVDGLPKGERVNASALQEELLANNIKISMKTIRRIVPQSGRRFVKAGCPVTKR